MSASIENSEIARVRAYLKEQIIIRTEQGWDIGCGSYFGQYFPEGGTYCCLLGLICGRMMREADYKAGRSYYSVAAERLGVHINRAVQLETGFEGFSGRCSCAECAAARNDHDAQAWRDLGAEMLAFAATQKALAALAAGTASGPTSKPEAPRQVDAAESAAVAA